MQKTDDSTAFLNVITLPGEPLIVFKAASTGVSYLQTSSTGIREIRSPAGGVM